MTYISALPDRNLGLHRAGRTGRRRLGQAGDKEGGNGAAVDAMCEVIAATTSGHRRRSAQWAKISLSRPMSSKVRPISCDR